MDMTYSVRHIHLLWCIKRNMKLDNQELHTLLNDKGIYHLYHANTVSTTSTFIKEGGLLSRGAVEAKGLYQTPQSSDSIDKLFNVWDDVFLDTVDLHKYFNRQNYYGPVVFKISTDFLLKENSEIWVTKDNPINWNQNMTDSQKYFCSVEELKQNWDKFQRQRKMTTIKNTNTPILLDYIVEVIVDDPGVKLTEEGIIVFNETVAHLKKSLEINPQLKNKFSTRNCSGCFCRTNYLTQLSAPELKKLFL